MEENNGKFEKEYKRIKILLSMVFIILIGVFIILAYNYISVSNVRYRLDLREKSDSLVAKRMDSLNDYKIKSLNEIKLRQDTIIKLIIRH